MEEWAGLGRQWLLCSTLPGIQRGRPRSDRPRGKGWRGWFQGMQDADEASIVHQGLNMGSRWGWEGGG
jgi:hypothetical protein